MRFPRPFFMSEHETVLFEEGDEPMPLPTVDVSSDKLMAAIEQVERLCEWLEEKMHDVKYVAQTRRD